MPIPQKLRVLTSTHLPSEAMHARPEIHNTLFSWAIYRDCGMWHCALRKHSLVATTRFSRIFIQTRNWQSSAAGLQYFGV